MTAVQHWGPAELLDAHDRVARVGLLLAGRRRDAGRWLEIRTRTPHCTGAPPIEQTDPDAVEAFIRRGPCWRGWRARG